MARKQQPHSDLFPFKHLNITDGSDSGAGSISSQASSAMSSLRDLTRSPTPHSIAGIRLSSPGLEVSKSARLARSPVTIKSVPSKLHDVSDGIRPATTKAYEKNISTCKDHLADENKEDYTRWLNYFHPDLIKEDVVAELADGEKLISVVNTLTGQQLVPEKGNSLHHQTLNVEKVIDCLRQLHIDVANLSAADVVRGRREAVLAVVWTLILNFSDGEIQDPEGLRAFLIEAELSPRKASLKVVKPLAIRSTASSLSYAAVCLVSDGEPAQLNDSQTPKPKHANGNGSPYFDRNDSGYEQSLKGDNSLPFDIQDREHIQSTPTTMRKTEEIPDPCLSQPVMERNQSPKTMQRYRMNVRQRVNDIKQKKSYFTNRIEFTISPAKVENHPPIYHHIRDENQNLPIVDPIKQSLLCTEPKECEQKESSSSPISSVWGFSPLRRALKVALPLQLLMLMVVGMSFMIPNMEGIRCFDCLQENNYIKEFGPIFTHPYPPPF